MTAANRLFSLDGRVALITGAPRGLGLAMAEGLAEAGATVVANGRSADTLEAVARALRERGLKADTSPFDVTDHRAAQAAIDAILQSNESFARLNSRVPLRRWASHVTSPSSRFSFLGSCFLRHWTTNRGGRGLHHQSMTALPDRTPHLESVVACRKADIGHRLPNNHVLERLQFPLGRKRDLRTPAGVPALS